MPAFHLLVGSMLGGTEYVADLIEETLSEQGHDVITTTDFTTQSPGHEDHIWLVISSTHGAGDLPDNIQPLGDWLAQTPDLHALKYGVIAIGDSSYDTFCQGGIKLDQLLTQSGAQRLGDVKKIDVQEDPIPEDVAIPWINAWIDTHFPVDK